MWARRILGGMSKAKVSRWPRELLGCFAMSFLAGCGSGGDRTASERPPRYAEYDLRREPPAILRDVALIDDEVEFTRPYVPAHRTTMDGRIGLRVEGADISPPEIAERLHFWLYKPERVNEPILPGSPGAAIVDAGPFAVPHPLLDTFDPVRDALGHYAICDATTDFPRPGERPNPRTCGPEGRHDCYEITILTTARIEGRSTIFGTEATVEVADPKTADARIVRVTLGATAKTEIPRSIGPLFEPSVTMDGRLLTGRFNRTPMQWTDPRTGEVFRRSYDLGYAVLPDDATPCDITAWTTFHPMSYAPFDPAMKGRYGLAEYPFRDTEGRLIPAGEDLGGTYPWVDRKGANVFMTGIPGRLADQPTALYPRRCANPGCETYEERPGWERGFLVAGLWTHGKFVLLDGMINHLDWAVGVTPASHWLVDLYWTNGAPVSVRVGAGRFIDSVRIAGGPYPETYTHNANILDSLENLFNFHPAARPVTPRDVVWVMSNGVASDEIAFDDYLDPNAFIVSTMQATVTPLVDEDGKTLGVPRYHNGQVWELEGSFAIGDRYRIRADLVADVHLQNGATSLRWNVPAFGLVEAGTGSVEPVAMGGIKGKGFWLTGANEIRYAVPPQPRDIDGADWYVGLFVDPRFAEGETRVLARFPDGTAILLHGTTELLIVVDDTVSHRIQVPHRDGWMHLGFALRDANTDVTFYLDGFGFDRFVSPRGLFRMVEGDLVVGGRAPDGVGFADSAAGSTS